MFDGNYRSQLRNINLSGNRQRPGNRSQQLQQQQHDGIGVHPPSLIPLRTSVGEGIEDRKRQVLESSRKLREERRLQQRKEQAAKQIQRYYRGWQSRRQLVHQTWTILLQQRQPQAVNNATSSPSVALLLSSLLSPPLLVVWKHQSSGSAVNQTTTVNHFRSALLQYVPSAKDSYVTQQRILQAILQELRPPSSSSSPASDETGNSFVTRCLQQAQAMLQLAVSPAANGRPVVTEKVFLALTLCTKEWLWRCNNNKSNVAGIQQQQQQEVIPTLWKWSCGVQLPTAAMAREQHALLATILLGWKTGLFRPQDQQTDALTQQLWTGMQNAAVGGGNETAGAITITWVQDLVDMMTSHKFVSTQESLLVSAVAENSERRQNILLSNVLDLCTTSNKSNIGNGRYPPDTMIRFIYHTFKQRPDVALLSSLVAGGVSGFSLRGMVGLTTSVTPMDTSNHNNEQEEDDDSLEDDDDDGLVRAPNSAGDAGAAAAGWPDQKTIGTSRTLAQQQRLTRQEVQTLPKLDRLYQQQVQLWRQQVLSECKASSSSSLTKTSSDGLDPVSQLELLVEVAIQIGGGTLWLEWGLALFPAKSNSTTSTSSTTSMIVDDDGRTQDLYLKCLFTLLQPSSGLRPVTSSKSPLLSLLAFSRGFLEGLWQYFITLQKDATTRNSSATNGSMLVIGSAPGGDQPQEAFWCTANMICHVFSHYLIALSDDEFLQHHTVTMRHLYQNTETNSILAEDAIALLRTMLHELYWGRPVLAGDVQVPYLADRDRNRDILYLKSLRSCALLSGTKLWNSLYERWCRLVRTAPFCEESMWWFPGLVGDAGVVHYHSARPPQPDSDDEGVENMDVDDSSEEIMDDAQVAMDAENEELAGAFRDPKMARILTSIPQALPFDRRVKMFHSLLATDKLKTQDEHRDFRRAMDRMIMMRGDDEDEGANAWAPREVVAIHRDNMYDDSMEQLNKLGPRLKQKVQITFINQHGTQEAGIDGGGVFKEFLDDLIKDAFVGDASKPVKLDAPRLFSVTTLQTLSVNPEMTQDPNILPHYEFLGRVLGKAVYESILVEPQFCLPFLNKLLSKPNSLEDLKNYDAEYYKNLIKLRSMGEDEIIGLGLAFELNIGGGDKARTVELIPGGRATAVTKENLSQYVHLVAHYMLNVQGAPQTRAFLRGFRDLIPASWVRLFSAYELQKVIGGDDSVRGIDVASLKQSMQYSAGYHQSQPIIEWFWEVVNELSPDQQRKLLKFMTSCSRQPLLGFNSLEPAPCIQQIRIAEDIFKGDDETVAKRTPLPTSSTCMNLLKLPNYRSKDLLRKKLLDAIEAGAGFELT